MISSQADKVAYLLLQGFQVSPDVMIPLVVASLFDVRAMLRNLQFGDASFLDVLLTNHPELLNEKDDQVKIP